MQLVGTLTTFRQGFPMANRLKTQELDELESNLLTE
jgi:hypothetical protein